jgi:hypothetical protein
MKKLATRVMAISLFATMTCVIAAHAANPVRISQVYGGGGATSGSPTYKYDYVELFNNSGVAVNIGGWALEYGASSGNFGNAGNNMYTFPVGTLIQPCKYYLIQMALQTGAIGPDLPVVADVTGATLNMSATNGKVALINPPTASLACAGSVVGGVYIDAVGWGTATCFETAATAATVNTSGPVRNNGGITDTDNNSTDFTIVTNPVPRNSQSPANIDCVATGTNSRTWGAIKTIYR